MVLPCARPRADAVPEPRRRASVVQTGRYALARQPMYGGVTLVVSGLALAATVPALVVAAALAALGERKPRREEERLLVRYGE